MATASSAPLRIAVLAGGLSHERDVSLRSGHRVAQVLKHLGHTVLTLDVDARTIASLRAFGPDVVWPLVHGSHGEDGGLQNVLIALGLPYVGTHSDGCQRASFKPTAKATVRTGGVLTPDSVTLPKSYFSQLGAQDVLGVVANHLGLPVVVKPNQGGSGLGVSLVKDADELRLFGEWMLRIYSEFIVQQYVGNAECEYTVGVLCDMDGNLINSIAVRKNILSALSCRMKIKSRFRDELLVISNGITQGAIGRYGDVTAQCEEIALALGTRSAINIQLRFVDGKANVFEINPRYSGTSSFRAMVGYNEPDILIRKHLLGETIEPHFPYREGVILRGLDEVFIPAEALSS